MTFKEFCKWANQRACDGKWDFTTCMLSISIIDEINQAPFWKRNRIWKSKYEFIASHFLKEIKRYYEKGDC